MTAKVACGKAALKLIINRTLKSSVSPPNIGLIFICVFFCSLVGVIIPHQPSKSSPSFKFSSSTAYFC